MDLRNMPGQGESLCRKRSEKRGKLLVSAARTMEQGVLSLKHEELLNLGRRWEISEPPRLRAQVVCEVPGEKTDS